MPRLLARSIALVAASSPLAGAWDANWASLDSRPTPAWYNNSKFGIFIHWGVYSVPSWGIENGNGGSGEWFWFLWEGSDVYNAKPVQAYVDFVAETEVPGFSYYEYAPRFTAELFDPNKWSQLFADAGAQVWALCRNTACRVNDTQLSVSPLALFHAVRSSNFEASRGVLHVE